MVASDDLNPPSPSEERAAGALPTDLVAALEKLAERPSVLVASDFDGVLAPFVHDPLEARPLDGTIDDLVALAGLPRTHTAVVSGRDLDTLGQLTGLADGSPVTRIGSHGAQSSHGDVDDLTDEQQQLLERLTGDLHDVVEAHPGVRLEHKPAATVLHTRGQEDHVAEAAVRSALEVAQRHTGVKVLQGKNVVEMSVVTADKGTALKALQEKVGADAAVYFGDDVTDEHAFEVMDGPDVSVKVGDGETAARFRVDTGEQVAEALRLLVRLRREATAS
jgi:trehalose 6-phosphate phosphatase